MHTQHLFDYFDAEVVLVSLDMNCVVTDDKEEALQRVHFVMIVFGHNNHKKWPGSTRQPGV